MTSSTVMIADMGILVGIFLLGFLAKLFPKKQGTEHSDGSGVTNRAKLER